MENIHNLIRDYYDKGLVDKKIRFKIHNSKEFIIEYSERYLDGFQWLPEYDQIVEWMEDNDGKGLILYGSNGRGKTFLAKRILPVFFHLFLGRIINIYNAQEMNELLDEILQKKLFIIDDVGTEDQKVDYGERRWAFPEIMDMAEKNDNLAILTTNLMPDDIEEKYGLRARERIRACCKPIKFVGETLRK